MAVGMRCQVMPGKRRGAVGFIGEVEGLAAGYWVGVKLDEPVGRNDGSRGDKKYFECEPGFGSFVRPKNTAVGDYPERDLLDDDDDDDEDEVEEDDDQRGAPPLSVEVSVGLKGLASGAATTRGHSGHRAAGPSLRGPLRASARTSSTASASER